MAQITSESRVLGLIDGIYDAGIACARWPAVLTRIADTFGARDAALGTIGPPGLSWMCAPRTDPEYLHDYPERFHAINRVWHRVVKQGVGASVTDQMVMDRREFRRSVYYNEWALPQGYRTVIGGLVDADDGWQTVLMLPARDDQGSEHLKLFGLLSPHIRRAVQLNRHLARATLERTALRESIECMSGAALLVDAGARVLAMNHAAQSLVAEQRGLRVTRGRLGTLDRDSGLALQRLIAQAAPETRSPGTRLELPTTAATALTISVIPLQRTVPMPGTPAALIVEADGPSPRDGAQRLRCLYGLTEAETRFAEEILKGDGKRAAAERCGISYSTARTHLSRIFEKTRVHRQAALVRLLKP